MEKKNKKIVNKQIKMLSYSVYSIHSNEGMTLRLTVKGVES